MKKFVFIFILLMGLTQTGFAQLGFASLSGKAKSKAAKKEALESKNDQVYQDFMKEGHEYFSNNEFEKAITSYEKAGKRRPINVYPKVKIADVQLAMLNYVEETPEETPERIAEEPITTDANPDPPSQDERIAEALANEEKKIRDSLPPAPKEVLEETPNPKNDLVEINTAPVTEENIKILSEDDFAESLAAKYKNGVTEEKFEEGNKKITRRVVVKNGKGADYRKVAHKWGGVFYFKNDETISRHTWDTETVLD